MHIELPPGLFYGIGAVLVVLGAMRAYYLGWQRREIEDEEGNVRKSADARRHLRWGIGYVIMGLFLVISTIVQVRRH